MMTDRQTQGTIVSIHSDVIDAHFPARLPKLNHLLRAGKENEYAMEVVNFFDEETVRTISLMPTQGLARGDAIRDTGDTLTVPVDRRVLGSMLDVFGATIDRKGPLDSGERRSIHQDSAPLSERATDITAWLMWRRL
jgi:F-type H+-transporting ATPase subunit beta